MVRLSIVILHGFNSSIAKAFTHSQRKNWVLDHTFWGRLWDTARILTFEYNVNTFSHVIRSRIIDHAEKLLEELYYERRRCEVNCNSEGSHSSPSD